MYDSNKERGAGSAEFPVAMAKRAGASETVTEQKSQLQQQTQVQSPQFEVWQLEVITHTPSGTTWLAPDGRLPHSPSLIRAAAGAERCAGVEDIYAQSTPGSADEVQARLGFSVAQA